MSPGNVALNQVFTFTFGSFSSTPAGVTFANARYDATIGGVAYIVFLGSDPSGGTFFPQLFGAGGVANLFNVTTTPTAFAAVPPPPSVSSIIRLDTSPTRAASVQYSVNFSAAVTGVDSSDFALTTTGLSGSSVGGVTGSGATYMVTVNTGTGEGSLRLDVVDDDTITAGPFNPLGGTGAGNANFTAGESYAVDTLAPTVTIDQAAGQADPTAASPIGFTVVFSEPVTGFTGADVSLGGTAGATTATVTGSGASYSVAVSGMTANGSVTASIAAGVAADAANNANVASTSTDNTVQFTGIDDVAPTVTINQAAGQADPAMASPINYTVIFSEPVTGFDASDVVLGGTAGANSAAVTGSGTTYNVAVSGMSLIGTVTVSVRPGAATDAAGNPSLASTSTDNVVQFGGGLPDARIVPASSPLTLLLLILGVMVIAAGARLRR